MLRLSATDAKWPHYAVSIYIRKDSPSFLYKYKYKAGEPSPLSSLEGKQRLIHRASPMQGW